MARTVKKKALTLEAQPYPVPDNWVWTTVGILNDYAGNSVILPKHQMKYLSFIVCQAAQITTQKFCLA